MNSSYKGILLGFQKEQIGKKVIFIDYKSDIFKNYDLKIGSQGKGKGFKVSKENKKIKRSRHV